VRLPQQVRKARPVERKRGLDGIVQGQHFPVRNPPPQFRKQRFESRFTQDLISRSNEPFMPKPPTVSRVEFLGLIAAVLVFLAIPVPEGDTLHIAKR